MYPTEYDVQAQRNQLEREAAHHRLVKLAQDGQPTLGQRIRARLNSVELMFTLPARQDIKSSDIIALS